MIRALQVLLHVSFRRDLIIRQYHSFQNIRNVIKEHAPLTQAKLRKKQELTDSHRRLNKLTIREVLPTS